MTVAQEIRDSLTFEDCDWITDFPENDDDFVGTLVGRSLFWKNGNLGIFCNFLKKDGTYVTLVAYVRWWHKPNRIIAPKMGDVDWDKEVVEGSKWLCSLVPAKKKGRFNWYDAEQII